MFWHCYDHPERRPDPDRETAMAATVAAFPSWYFRAVCGACRHAGWVNQIWLTDDWGERPVREMVAALRCKKCGSARLERVELVSRLDAQTAKGPIRRVRLVG